MDIQSLISETAKVIKDTVARTKESNFGDAVKYELMNNSEQLQNMLNAILSNAGTVTQEQLDALDEQLRLQKMKLLELKSQKTKKKYAYILGATIFGIGLLWFYVVKKK